MAITAFNSGGSGKKMYKVYTYSPHYSDHNDKTINISSIVPNYKSVTADDFYWGRTVNAAIGGSSGTHNVIMSLQVRSYDANTGIVTVGDSGTSNCGMQWAELYCYSS